MTGVRIRANEPGADTARVFLDGEPLELCLEADDAAGWADVLQRDAITGRLVLEYGRAVVRRLFGRVEITRS